MKSTSVCKHLCGVLTRDKHAIDGMLCQFMSQEAIAIGKHSEALMVLKETIDFNVCLSVSKTNIETPVSVTVLLLNSKLSKLLGKVARWETSEGILDAFVHSRKELCNVVKFIYVPNSLVD